MKAFLSLFLAYFFISGAQASEWSTSILTMGKLWNESSTLFSDPYASTLWGAIHQESLDLTDENRMNNTVYLHASGYGKSTPAYLMTQKRPNSPFYRNAPLMVILPGIFDSATDGNELAKAEHFYAAGFHVLILSNPWSLDAIRNDPQNKPGDVIAEANWILASIQATISQELNASTVSSVSIYGESYGAFLGGVVAGLDDPQHPLITGKVVLASPPLDMMAALLKLDAMVDNTATAQGPCKESEIKIAMSFMMAGQQASVPTAYTQCSQSLVALSFNQSLGRSILGILKTNLSVPAGPFQTRFQYYIENFVPEENTMCLTTSKCHLSYWLGQAVQNGKKNFIVISASDDFLNEKLNWNEVSQVLPDAANQLVLLNWGGHLGYMATSLYRESFYL